MANDKRDVCKTCNTEVEYYKIMKPNGKETHRAFHIGEKVPDDAELIDKKAVSSTYRNRMRSYLHTDKQKITNGKIKSKKQKSKNVNDSEDNSSETIETEQEPEPKSLTYTESHEVPEESVGKPIVDISEIKRNKFALVGSILRTMKENGAEDLDIHNARSSFIMGGTTFEKIVQMAAPHVQIIENGIPLHFI